jgi:TonB family protein
MKTFLLTLAASSAVHGAALVCLYQGAATARLEVTVPQPAGRISMRIVPLPSSPPPAEQPPRPAAPDAPAAPEPPPAPLPAEEAKLVVSEPVRAGEADIVAAPDAPEPPGDAPDPFEAAPTALADAHMVEPPDTPPPRQAASDLGIEDLTPPSFAWIETGVRTVLDQAADSYVYPWRCIEDGCDGRVRLGITVDTDGRVSNVRVLSSSTACSHLDRSCVEQTAAILADTWFVYRGAAPPEQVVVRYDVVWRLTE